MRAETANGAFLDRNEHFVFPRQAGKNTTGMVLLSHGIFSFGKDARESYERMIELVSMAEEYLQRKKAWHIAATAPRAATVKRDKAPSGSGVVMGENGKYGSPEVWAASCASVIGRPLRCGVRSPSGR